MLLALPRKPGRHLIEKTNLFALNPARRATLERRAASKLFDESLKSLLSEVRWLSSSHGCPTFLLSDGNLGVPSWDYSVQHPHFPHLFTASFLLRVLYLYVWP
jgi:hypothetical protein